MIDARELRIGNWVEAPCFGIVNSIQKTLTISDIQHCQKFPDRYKPIPLTEEWLLKFGVNDFGKAATDINFVSYHKGNNKFYYAIAYYYGEDGYVYTNDIEIKYVHQLQNLYFALTGTELELK